jgi:glutathione peroxidase
VSVYSFEVKNIKGVPQSMADFKGKVLLIVNTASYCGFTPQFKGLEALYEKYRSRGFEILGFPCNQFGAQDPGSETEIAAFCDLNYKISFPMFGKVEVNGPNANPLYEYLKSSKKGLLGTEAIKWNFTKFLVDQEGEVVERFAPTTTPEDIAPKIEALLSK